MTHWKARRKFKSPKRLENPRRALHTRAMQTGCPKCKTIVRINGQEWTILNGACPELVGTRWDGKPEYCPILTVVAEPDGNLPGTAIRASVQAEIDRIKVIQSAHSLCCPNSKTCGTGEAAPSARSSELISGFGRTIVPA